MKKVLLSFALLCSGSFVCAKISEKDQEIISSASEKIADEMLRSFVRTDLVEFVQRSGLTPEEKEYVRALALCLAKDPHSQGSHCENLISAFLYNDSANGIAEWRAPVAMAHFVEEARRAQGIL